MSVNTFGRLLRVTTWGESHGPAMGAVVDGCPPGVELREENIQPWLDWRRPGSSRYATQRREPDVVRILSGTFNGRTTGTPISLLIDNVDSRSKDYEEIAGAYRPGHADYVYEAKYSDQADRPCRQFRLVHLQPGRRAGTRERGRSGNPQHASAHDVIARAERGKAAILISPGPGEPNEAGCTMEVIASAKGRIPLIGI